MFLYYEIKIFFNFQLQKALLRGIVDTLTKAGFVTDSISLGDTKFMVRIPLQ